MIETKLVHVEPDSPLRCQDVYKSTQCPYEVLPGTDKCAKHTHASAVNKRLVRNYTLARIRGDVEAKLQSPEQKSLREEIAILRLLLERVINSCTDEHDLLLSSQRISDLVVKVQGLVSACHKIEITSGVLIDKNNIIQLAELIVKIIGNYISDPEIIDRISEEIPKAIFTLGTINPDE